MRSSAYEGGSTPKPGLFWGPLPKSPTHLRSQNQALVQGPPSTHPRRQIWRASLGPGIDFVAEKPSFCQNQPSVRAPLVDLVSK